MNKMQDLYLDLTHIKTATNISDSFVDNTIYIDPSRIVTVSRMKTHLDDEYTKIVLDGQVIINVEETPADIAEKLLTPPEEVFEEE